MWLAVLPQINKKQAMLKLVGKMSEFDYRLIKKIFLKSRSLNKYITGNKNKLRSIFV